jgi:hypothetical protein
LWRPPPQRHGGFGLIALITWILLDSAQRAQCGSDVPAESRDCGMLVPTRREKEASRFKGRCRAVHSLPISHMINSLPSTSPDLAEVGYSIRSCPPSARRQYGAKYGRIALIRFDSLGSPPNPPAKMTPFTLIRFDSLGSPPNPPAKTTAVYLDRFDSLNAQRNSEP